MQARLRSTYKRSTTIPEGSKLKIIEMETNLSIKYKWIVYCTTNTVNGNIYIGVHKTENPEVFDGYIGCNVRINHPSSYMDPQTPFQFAVKKYGPSKFKRSIIKIFDSKKEAFDLEAELVNADFIKRRDTYNASLGGNGGRLGKTLYQFDFEGNLIKEWESISEACEFYNLLWHSLYNALNFKLSRYGYYWSWETSINISEYSNNAGVRVYKYDGETKKLCDIYESFHEAARINNVKQDRIQTATKGGYKVNGFYYSREKHETFPGMEKFSLRNRMIYIYTLGGEYVTTLTGTREISEFFKTKCLNGIMAALRSGLQYREFQISLEKVDRMNPIIDKRKLKKKVGQYTNTGDLIKIYDTVTSARKEHGAGVSRCLKGQQKTCHNFAFKYIS